MLLLLILILSFDCGGCLLTVVVTLAAALMFTVHFQMVRLHLLFGPFDEGELLGEHDVLVRAGRTRPMHVLVARDHASVVRYVHAA